MLEASYKAHKPLTKAELGQIIEEFSTVKEAKNPSEKSKTLRISSICKYLRLTPN